MPEIVSNVVDVYPYRFRAGKPEFLVLRRSKGVVYGGDWRMVGGKIRANETAWETAARELKEETGLVSRLLWTLPSANTFYEWQSDRIYVVAAFAAEVDAQPVLNHEHDASRWLESEDAASLLAWPEQRRLIRLAAEELAGDISVSWRVAPHGSPDMESDRWDR